MQNNALNCENVNVKVITKTVYWFINTTNQKRSTCGEVYVFHSEIPKNNLLYLAILGYFFCSNVSIILFCLIYAVITDLKWKKSSLTGSDYSVHRPAK